MSIDRLLLLALVCLFASPSVAGDGAERPLWTTSRVVGSPEPPPKFRTAPLFPEIRFDHPVAVAMPPGDHCWWVVEQAGKVFRIDDRAARARKELVVDLKEEVGKRDQTEPRRLDFLYGIAFHPQFATNRQVFLSYTVVTGKPNEHLKDGTRVSRFRVSDEALPRIVAEPEEILLTFLEGGHNGACLAFGPDGCLYISSGDAEGPSPPDILKTGQDNSDLLSSVLRIDVDRPGDGRGYSVPKDNPFVGLKDVQPEIWAYGFRNPWKMSFDRETGELWVGDVGWEMWELIHRVERGGNYGWSIVEGRQPVHADLDPGPSPISPPVIELPHTMAASITGGFVYRGSRFPELRGSYIFGDWETRRIWAWPTKQERVREAARELVDLTEPSVRVITFGEDHEGELCVVDYDAGTMHGFERQPVDAEERPPFPTRLSETGLFESVADHRVAAGVRPFDIRVPQWSDGADGERYLALPGDGRIAWHPDSVEIPGSMFRRHLEFPAGAVLMKTLTWPADALNPQPRRIETQLLHYDGRQWRGYSYRWNEEQTDGVLVPADGDETELQIADASAPEGRRTLTWTFSSRTQCLVCHNQWAETTLAFNVDQLGRLDGETTSTWEELCEEGLIRMRREDQLVAVDVGPERTRSRLVNPRDTTAVLEQRARSYLHVNCAHCHQSGGGTSAQIELRIGTAPEQLKALDAPPLQGGFGLEDARIIAPGDPYRSSLYLRMAKTGRGRMPHLASERPDDQGLNVIQDWIESLDGKQSSPAVARAASAVVRGDLTDLRRCLDNPTSALALATVVRRQDCAEIVKHLPRTSSGVGSDPVIQDLFVRYLALPTRKVVGAVPRPRAILDRTGDVERGKTLFSTSTTLNCRTCHRVGSEGGEVGPELTGIAGKRSREGLLESLLDPSRDVEPRYAAFVLQTEDGRVHSGLLVSRVAGEIVLRDAKGELVKFRDEEVESFRPQRASLMPEGLLRDLTFDEAADLLAYLESLK